MCGDERTEGGTLGTGATVSPVMSLPSRSFTVMLMLVRTAGKGRDQYMHESNYWTKTMAPQSWYGVQSTTIQNISGVVTWLHTFNKFIRILSYPV